MINQIVGLIILILVAGIFDSGLYFYTKKENISVSKNSWIFLLSSEVIALLIIYISLF